MLYEAPTRTGGALRYFLIWDMVVVVFLLTCVGGLFVKQDFGPDDFMFWTTLCGPPPHPTSLPHPRRAGRRGGALPAPGPCRPPCICCIA